MGHIWTALLRYQVLSTGYSLQSFLSPADDPFYKYVRCNIIHETLDRVRFQPMATISTRVLGSVILTLIIDTSIPDARSAIGK